MRESLKPMLAEYKSRKYIVAVFESGEDKDIKGMLERLAYYNKYVCRESGERCG